MKKWGMICGWYESSRKNIIKEIKEGMWGGVLSWKDIFSLYDLSFVFWCDLRIFYNELIFFLILIITKAYNLICEISWYEIIHNLWRIINDIFFYNNQNAISKDKY